MKCLFVTIFVILGQTLLVKSQDFQWAIGSGDRVDDLAIGLASDTDGNAYMCGHLNGGTMLGDITFDEGGAYLTKITSIGDVDWAVSFGSLNTYGVDIAIDSEGNVYLAGIYSHGFTYEGISLPGGLQSRIYLMKFTAEGILIWSKDYGTISDTGRSYVNAIAIDESDNIHLGGNFQNPIQLGDSTYNVRGRESFDSDMLIIELSPKGDVLSVKNPGSSSDEYIYDLAISPNGIYVTGYFAGQSIEFEGLTYEGPKNGLGGIFKYSLDGQLIWVNTINAPSYSEAFSITVNRREEAILAGLWSEGNFDVDKKIFVAKVEGANGEILNIQLINHSEYLGSYIPGVFGRKRWDLTSNESDTYLSAGLSGSIIIDHLNFTSSGSRDAAILKFNEIGYPQWITAAQGTGNDMGLRISSQGTDIYMAGDYASDQLRFSENVLINNNSGNNDNDFFLSKSVDNSSNLCPDQNSFAVSYPANFCEGDSILLIIENKYATYTKWTLDNVDLNKSNKKQIYVNQPGFYEVEINSDTGCPVPPINIKVELESKVDEETDIIMYERPRIEGPEEICIGDTLNLTTHFDDDFQYAWLIPENLSANDTTSNTLQVLIDDAYDEATFHLEVNDLSTDCTFFDSLVVKTNPIPIVDIESSGKKITVYSDNATSFLWFLEGVELKEFEDQESIDAQDVGNYYVQGINEYGCTTCLLYTSPSPRDS